MTDQLLKLQAAQRALDFVEDGMKLGLGTGSTAAAFIELLGARVASGLAVICVPTSEDTRAHAGRLGIPLTTLDDHPRLDLTIDGADEIDDELRLIKGGGGALLREKIVASASSRMLVIADRSKQVTTLGRFPLPVEVVRFGMASTIMHITAQAEDVGCIGEIRLRTLSNGNPYLTDTGNVILDCAFGRIDEPELLADALEVIPGVVEHGLFLGLADAAVVAGPDGIELLAAVDDDDDD